MELRGYVLHCAEIRLSETRPTQTQTLAQRQKTSINTRQIQRERQTQGSGKEWMFGALCRDKPEGGAK